MTKDYAKRRRVQPSATRRFNAHSAKNSAGIMPAWAWTILGLLLGVGLSAIMYWKLHSNPAPIQTAAVEIQEELPPTTKTTQKRKAGAKPKNTGLAQTTKSSSRFDFYTVLPSMDPTGVDVSEPSPGSNALELALQKPLETKASPEDLPTIIDDEPQLPLATTTPEPALSEKKPAASLSYIIQAGSFHRLQQAEELKAQLAFSGFEASIQTFKMGAKDTRYRVLIGPFASKDQAYSQQHQLEQSQPLHSVVLKIGV